jgi:hypothetical protein
VLIAYFVFYTHCLVYGLADIVFSKGGAFLNTTREASSPQREPIVFLLVNSGSGYGLLLFFPADAPEVFVPVAVEVRF